MNVTPPDAYSNGTLFGGVTDWYQEPRSWLFLSSQFLWIHQRIPWGHLLDELSYSIPIIAPTISPSLDYTPASPDYLPTSDTESDPYEDPSSDHIPSLPAISPFLSSRHLLSDHSSPDLSSTSAGASRKIRRSPMTLVPALLPVFGALSLIYADLIPSPKRVRDSSYSANVEAEIDECLAYADALRYRRIDARVVFEAVDREESEIGARGPVEVRVDRVTHPVVADNISEPAQEGAV
ncbi:hypothetical protein Tco_1486033 [Tanacetum coccineum]